MRVIILTRSDKYNIGYEGGYCVAGLDADNPQRWIRLVGQHEHMKITNAEAVYDDGRLCEPLDLIEVDGNVITEEMIVQRLEAGADYFQDYDNEGDPEYRLLYVQPENFLINGRFRFIRKMNIDEVINMAPVETGDFIFSNDSKCLSIVEAIRNNKSLTIAKVEDLALRPKRNYYNEEEFQSHYKASFTYNGVHYEDITVTDPDYAAELTNFEGLDFGDTYIVMSVGGEFLEHHYKLIAKIFETVYTIENNMLNYFHAFRDCRYLQRYDNVQRALYQDMIDEGLTQCRECANRRNAADAEE